MGYVSKESKIGHAQGAHRASRRDEDLIVEWWRVANVSRYTHMAVPKDEIRQQCVLAAALMTSLCDLDYVYKTGNKRWELFTKIEAYKKKYNCSIPEAIIGCSGMGYGGDCSATNLACLYWAGVPFKGTWRTYTGGLQTVLKKSGVFDIYTDKDHTTTDKYAVCGALYWKENAHVVMSVTDYSEWAEKIDEKVEEEFKSDDRVPSYIKPYVEVVNGTIRIRNKPTTILSKTLGFAKKGDKFDILDVTANKWYKIKYNDEEAYISGNTSNTQSVNVE